MKLYPIETGNLKLDGGAMFGVVPKVLWSKAYPCDENNLCNWSMRCLLVVDGDRKILIDNGIGEKQDEKWLKHYYLNGESTLESSLKRTGYEAGDKPNRREKASFLRENILPIQESGQLKLIEEENEYIPNITFKMYHGHTEGQVIPHIKVNGKTVVFMADLMPSAAHIPMPWIMAYDSKPLQTLKDRERFYKDALKDDYILFFEHDINNEVCTIHNTEKGVRVKEVGKLADFLN